MVLQLWQCVCLAFFAVSSASGEDNPPSYWTKNISYMADPAGEWFHDKVKMVSSGNNLHLFWEATKKDYSAGKLLCARSTEGGSTIEMPRSVFNGSDGFRPALDTQCNNVVVDGVYIHAVFRCG